LLRKACIVAFDASDGCFALVFGRSLEIAEDTECTLAADRFACMTWVPALVTSVSFASLFLAFPSTTFQSVGIEGSGWGLESVLSCMLLRSGIYLIYLVTIVILMCFECWVTGFACGIKINWAQQDSLLKLKRIFFSCPSLVFL
jgi:hypothetical protein